MKPLVSAIITTHNRLQLLKRAIDSVLSQTYDNVECIIVSDNSSDGTIEYCSQLENVIFINISASESHGGNYARNVGINASHGVYISFLDDDDYWLPTKIEKQLDVAQKKNCGLVYCGRRIEIVSAKNRIEYQEELPQAINSGNMSKRVLYTICTTTSAILISRDALEKVGLYDENLKFWQEYELCIRLAQVTEFHYVPETLMVYRIDASDKERLTNKYYEWWESVDYIKKKHRQLYSKLTLRERRKLLILIYKDACTRAQNSRLDNEMNKLYRRLKFISCPEIIHDKIVMHFNNK